MRIHRPDVPLGAFERIPDYLPIGPDTDPLVVLTKVTLLGVDRDSTVASLNAQQTVKQANPKLSTEWDDWVDWCQRWQENVTERCNEKTHIFRPNDDASIESAEYEYVRLELTDWKLRWASAGASGMGFPQVPPVLPEQPPVEPPPGDQPEPEPEPEPEPPPPPPGVPPKPSDETSHLAILALLGLGVVAFYVARGKQ